MSQELSLGATITYEDAFGVSATVDIPAILATLSTKKVLHTIQTVGITEEALVMGDITTPCLVYLRNLDDSNYLEVKAGTGGAITDKLDPNNIPWLIRPLGSGSQTPFVIAHTAECELEIFLCAL